MSPKTERRESTPLSRAEQEIVEEHLPLRSPVVYEVVRQEGETELRRPVSSLWWSGTAAGIAMLSSVLGQAVLMEHLPDAPWAVLIWKSGYCFGFLIVVLGRVQLFTENTVTAVLPLLANWSGTRLAHTARLWSVVLLANIVGTFVTAALVIRAGLFPPAHVAAMLDVAAEFADNSFLSSFLYGIPAGFLIAAIVWVTRRLHARGGWLGRAVAAARGRPDWHHAGERSAACDARG
jgi:formate/nitrite transporter FocA (FNT family)